uniref:Uncharacterized protein n=1 Tax=Acrobeloides nanus TaxID=290746 RepID=A0A914EMN2_9BILA
MFSGLFPLPIQSFKHAHLIRTAAWKRHRYPNMPYKILITQPSSDPPPSDPSSSEQSKLSKKPVKKKVKKLAKQKAESGDDEEFFDGVSIGDDDAAALLAEIEGDSSPAYQSVQIEYAQPRRPSAPSTYEYNKEKSPSPNIQKPPLPVNQNLNTAWSERSRSVEPEGKEQARLAPSMTQSLYIMADNSDDDLFDGLDLDDDDAAKLLEEFEVEEYDHDMRRARSATPSPASNVSSGSTTPVKKKKIVKKVVKKKKPVEQENVATPQPTATTNTTPKPVATTQVKQPEVSTASTKPASAVPEKKITTLTSTASEKKSASTSNLAQEKQSSPSSGPSPSQPQPNKAPINAMWEKKVTDIFKGAEQNNNKKSAINAALEKKASLSPSPQPEAKPKTAINAALEKKASVNQEKPGEERRKSLLDVLNERKTAAKAGSTTPSPSPSPEPETKVIDKKVTKVPEPVPKVVEKKLGKTTSAVPETKATESKTNVNKSNKDLPNGEVTTVKKNKV